MRRRLTRRLLPLGRSSRSKLETSYAFAVPAGDIQVLEDPAAFRHSLLALIAQATRRIVLVALYLQDDDAGREVLDALYAAKKAQPSLEVEVYVD